MTLPRDAYWDELGVAWRAINPDVNVIVPRLKARLRRQSFLIAAGLIAGLPLSAAGLLLGLLTIWSGWNTGTWNFVTRGIAIGVVSLILATATSLLLPVRASDAVRAVSEMIDLAIARSQRTLLAIRLGFCACAVAAVFGLAGMAIRTYLTRPPRMSPLVDLAALAICALGLYLYGRQVKVNLDKMRYLKHALAVDGIIAHAKE
jgi:hypothetical protein